MLNDRRFRKGYIDGPTGQIHYRECGAGEPLVLLHQSPLSGAMFAPAMPLLAERGLRVVAIDSPGYGMSDVPESPLGLAEFADAIAEAIDTLFSASVHLLGHHTGAAVAANIAVRHSASVKRLVLNGVPLLSADERAFFESLEFGPRVPAADGSHLIDVWNQRLAASPGWTNLAAMHKHVVDMLATGDRYGDAFRAVFAHDMAGDLAAIACPTLILTNTGEDLYAASKRAHAERPDMQFVSLDGGTHDIVDEQPENWSRVVADFLVVTTA
ncbi:MAG: alpha/beta hydrolase [Pseudomonadota bacterium]